MIQIKIGIRKEIKDGQRLEKWKREVIIIGYEIKRLILEIIMIVVFEGG